MGPHPAVAVVRRAVRRVLEDATDRSDADRPALVACSGGADSLALVAATVFESTTAPVVGVTVDHGLHDDSAERAEHVAAQMAALGAHKAEVVRVHVERSGQGLEAAARDARYDALRRLAAEHAARMVLLGHTLDDQAETVLLGLARGSGGRSLAGMRERSEVFCRPLLHVTRAQTEAACRAAGIEFWHDPHNRDPQFTRARVRHTVLPVLERELGPGVAAALARTADLLRGDVDALDGYAEGLLRQSERDGGVDAAALRTAPHAVVTRVLRSVAVRAGASATELAKVHIDELARLLHGRPEPATQVQLPGRVTAYRDGDCVKFRATAVEG